MEEEEIEEEGLMGDAVDALTKNKLKIIFEQMENCICKIIADKKGTGFFCKIPYLNKLIPVLITNYHIIDDEFLKAKKQIELLINDEQKLIIINLNEKKKIYSN